jgi:hypothetical protein
MPIVSASRSYPGWLPSGSHPGMKSVNSRDFESGSYSGYSHGTRVAKLLPHGQLQHKCTQLHYVRMGVEWPILSAKFQQISCEIRPRPRRRFVFWHFFDFCS